MEVYITFTLFWSPSGLSPVLHLPFPGPIGLVQGPWVIVVSAGFGGCYLIAIGPSSAGLVDGALGDVHRASCPNRRTSTRSPRTIDQFFMVFDHLGWMSWRRSVSAEIVIWCSQVHRGIDLEDRQGRAALDFNGPDLHPADYLLLLPELFDVIFSKLSQGHGT